MQYLLTEEEMGEVHELRMRAAKFPRTEAMINVCRHVATTMIQTININGSGKSDRPHGCIHVPDPRGEAWQTPYCDGCQVAGICPQPKEYSK